MQITILARKPADKLLLLASDDLLHCRRVLSCLLQITILAHKPDNELLLFAIDGLSHQHQSFMCLCLLQITILARKPDDELLLLASDGLWDVLTNQEACSLAKRCLRRARQRGATRQSAARIAATVLTRAAVDRGSRDNVTVVVVDLMSGEAFSIRKRLF